MTALGALLRRHPDRAAVAVLVVLPLVLWAPALRPGHTLSPLDNLFTSAPWRAIAPGPVRPNQALGDVTSVFHPWTLWAAHEVRAGRVPLWNPYAYAGAPFFSNPQTACVFPLTWLAWALPPTWALTVPALLKLIAAGLATYWFLRGLALLPLAAFVGAAGFMLSTTLIAWLPWTLASTMPFLPLLAGLVDRLRARGDRRLVALLALAVALDLVAGYPQAALQALAAIAAWALARAPWRAGAGPFLARVAAGVTLGGALTAVQALPALDYARESAVYAFRSTWTPPLSVPPRAPARARVAAWRVRGARGGGTGGGDARLGRARRARRAAVARRAVRRHARRAHRRRVAPAALARRRPRALGRGARRRAGGDAGAAGDLPAGPRRALALSDAAGDRVAPRSRRLRARGRGPGGAAARVRRPARPLRRRSRRAGAAARALSRARGGGAAGRLHLAAASDCAGGADCNGCAGGADCNGCAGGADCNGCA